MSANKSQGQLRAIAMAAPIAHYLEHELFVECGTCRRREFVKLDRFPLEATVGLVVARLKCQRCKVAPAVVVLTDRELRRQVRLLGPGAFA